MKQNSFYITTTLPYVNAPLHMGHALEFVRADVIARYKKLQENEVFFNTGTDEHGLKIFEKAKENNLTPQEFVNNGFENFKKQLTMFGISEDIHFVRTTDEHHIKSAQEFWRKVSNNGYIYKKNYESKYCVGCESEKTDSELIDGFCPDHPGKDLVIISEENYFFKYSAFTEKLLKFYEENPNFVVPDFRYNEIKAFVSRGLQDFSISRLKEKMPWGIPVPDDENHVMYVWFDALTNYISTLGWPEDTENFEKFWKNGNPTQYCGKDNLRFQSAMWQAMLIAADLPNSHQIIINGFITADGGVKMSKTLGNVVDPKDIVAEYGTDALRFFLLSEVSSFEDSPFTIERFKESYNAKLANGLGNLTSRIMTMAENNQIAFDYKIAMHSYNEQPVGLEIKKALDNYNIKEASEIIWREMSWADNFIQNKQPFKTLKNNPEEGKEEIKRLLVQLWSIANWLEPIMPETSQKIIELIKENKKPEQPLFLRKD